MSKTIDEKIVELSLTTPNLEKNASTAMNIFKKLEQALNFNSSTKGIDNVGKALGNIKADEASAGISTLTSKFTALEAVALGVLLSIGNRLTSLAIDIGKKLTLDPMIQGFNEYETKLKAIQTIMANDQSIGMAEVTKVLKELNDYADLTIYNFGEMTRAIGLFTSSGIKAKDATQVIKGLANAAAGQGVDPTKLNGVYLQISQALSAGRFNLQDWNSILQAGLGGKYFQDALIQTAKDMGRDVGTAETSFIESLRRDGGGQSWLDADIFVETTKRLANDPNLIKAATNVKTITQLFDTIQESIGSGWAESFELIIGDFGQASEVLTNFKDAFDEFIGPSTEARNAMLKFWNVNGGRDAIINVLANGLRGVADVMILLEASFKNVFGTITGPELTAMSKKFEQFSNSIKPSTEEMGQLYTTFKGLFSIVGIVTDMFGSFFRVFSINSGGLKTFRGLVFDVTEYLGKWAIAIRQFLQLTRPFEQDLTIIRDVMSSLIDAMVELVSSATHKIQELFDLDFNKLNDPLGFLLDTFSKVNEETGVSILQFDGILKTIQRMVIAAGDYVEQFTGFDLSEVLPTMKKGVEGLMEYVSKMYQTFGGDTISLDSFKDGIISAFSEVRDYLSSATAKGMFDDFIDYIKSDLPSEIKVAAVKMKEVGTFITTSFLSLFDFETKGFDGVTETFNKLFDFIARGFQNLAGVFKSIGSGLKTVWDVVSAAIEGLLKALNITDWESFFNRTGIIALLWYVRDVLTNLGTKSIKTGVVDVLGAAKDALEAFQSDLKSKTLMTIALALGVLTASLIALTFVDFDKLQKATGVLTVLALGLLGMMTAFSKLNLGGAGALAGLGLAFISMATGIGRLVTVMQEVITMKWEDIEKGLVVIAALAAILTASTAIMVAFGENAKSVGLAITALAIGIKIIIDEIEDISKMSPAEIFKGVLVIGALTSGLAAAITIMGSTPISKNLAKTLLAFSGSIWILSGVVEDLGGMKFGDALQGVTAIGVLMFGLAAALKVAEGDIGDAAGLLAMSAGIFIIGGVVKSIGKLDFGSALQGVVAISTLILAITTSLKLLGTNSTGAVIGAAALMAVSFSLKTVIPVFEAFAGMTWGDIGKTMVAVSSALGVLGVAAYAFGAGAPMLALGAAVMWSLGKALEVLGPALALFVDSVVHSFDTIITYISSLAQSLFDGGVSLITFIVNGMTSVSSGVVNWFSTNLSSESMLERVGSFVGVGSAIVNNIMKGLSSLMEPLRNTVSNLWTTIGDGWDDGINYIKNKAGEFGDFLTEGLIGGLRGGEKDSEDATGDVASSILNTFKEVMDINSPSVEMEELGKYCMEGLKNGIANTSIANSIKSSLDSLSKEMIKKFNKTDWNNLGRDLINALRDGFSRNKSILLNYLTTLVNDMVNEVSDGYSSMEIAGELLAQGIINGMNALRGQARSAATIFANDMATAAIDEMNAYSRSIDSDIRFSTRSTRSVETYNQPVLDIPAENTAAMVASIEDVQPVITPILDLDSAMTSMASLMDFMNIGLGGYSLSDVNAATPVVIIQNESVDDKPTQITYNQNNYSPKALSRIDIYRQTKNSIKQIKGVIT